MEIISWRIIPYLRVFMVKPCRQDQRLILLSFFRTCHSSNLVSFSLAFVKLFWISFLVSWFAKELYLRVMTDQI